MDDATHDRSLASKRADIVCAIYALYTRLKGFTRPNIQSSVHELNTADPERMNELYLHSDAFIAERIGSQVLFAPYSCFFDSADSLIYQQAKGEESAALQQHWQWYIRETQQFQLADKTPDFYTPEKLFSPECTLPQSYLIYPSHVDAVSNEWNGRIQAWKNCKKGKLLAIGNHKHTDSRPYQAAFERIRPGNIICCRYDADHIMGIGVALSACKKQEDIFYAGYNAEGHHLYQYYIDVAWLIDNSAANLTRKELGIDTGDVQHTVAIPTRIPAALSQYLFNTSSHMDSSAYLQKVNKLVKLLSECRNLVLTGPPGTGKTHLAKDIAKLMKATEKTTGFTQFHPSYDYTDFVEGLRPTKSANGFERRDGSFKAFCRRAWKDKDKKPHVFIIDEINRGELSRIFGELFFSLDPGYRGKEKNGRSNCVQTQYQQLITDENDPFYYDEEKGGGFFVPENVYIIGTMNDIDRSVESMDFAIRRRFTWYEVTVDLTAAAIIAAADSQLTPAQQQEALRRMGNLNEKITELLGKDYQIGGAYFAKLKEDDYDALWNYHLHGLLHEYLRGRSDAPKVLDELKAAYDSAKA